MSGALVAEEGGTGLSLASGCCSCRPGLPTPSRKPSVTWRWEVLLGDHRVKCELSSSDL